MVDENIFCFTVVSFVFMLVLMCVCVFFVCLHGANIAVVRFEKRDGRGQILFRFLVLVLQTGQC